MLPGSGGGSYLGRLESPHWLQSVEPAARYGPVWPQWFPGEQNEVQKPKYSCCPPSRSPPGRQPPHALGQLAPALTAGAGG